MLAVLVPLYRNCEIFDIRYFIKRLLFSRIASHYEICKLSGQDIRMYKKRLMNRK